MAPRQAVDLLGVVRHVAAGAPGDGPGEAAKAYREIYCAISFPLLGVALAVGFLGRSQRRRAPREPPMALLLAGVGMRQALLARSVRLALTAWVVFVPGQVLAVLPLGVAVAMEFVTLCVVTLVFVAAVCEGVAARSSHGVRSADGWAVAQVAAVVATAVALDLALAREQSIVGQVAATIVASRPDLTQDGLQRLVDAATDPTRPWSLLPPLRLAVMAATCLGGAALAIETTARAVARAREAA